MDRPKRRWFVIAGLALGVGLLLFGRQALLPEDAENRPARVEAGKSFQQPTADVDGDDPPSAPEPAHEATPSEPAAVAAGGTLRGRVLDAAARSPVTEFELQLEPHGERFDVNKKPPITRTFQSRSGRFAWQDAPAGNWTLTVTARGYQRFEMSELRVASDKATREMVLPLLRGHELKGRVFEEASGVGIGAATIGFREAHEPRFSMRALARPREKTKEDGTFVLAGVPAGRVTVTVSARNYLAREIDITVGGKTAALEVGLATGGRISGYLASADGSPAAGSVTLFNIEQRGSVGHRTDDAGAFAFEHLAAGRYEVTGTASSGSGSQQIALMHNQQWDGIVITLAGGRSVRGIVRGAAPGDPQERHVSLHHMARPGVFLRSRVDEQGAYVISGVPPGSVQVTLSGAAQQFSKTAVVPADKDLTLDFDAPAGFRLFGRLSHRGKPVVGKTVWAMSLAQAKNRHYEATTSAQGTYEIEGIVAGDYAVAAEGVAERRFEIRGDTALDIEVPSTQLGGRVLEEGSEIPIVGAGIQITRMQAALPSNIQIQEETDHFGRFAATGLEAGEILLNIYKPGYEMYRERLDYYAPVTNMTIRLRPSSGVEVRVQPADRLRRHLFLSEMTETGTQGIQLRIALDENGVGSLPSALAGSTFDIYGGGKSPIRIREWDAEPLELEF